MTPYDTYLHTPTPHLIDPRIIHAHPTADAHAHPEDARRHQRQRKPTANEVKDTSFSSLIPRG